MEVTSAPQPHTRRGQLSAGSGGAPGQEQGREEGVQHVRAASAHPIPDAEAPIVASRREHGRGQPARAQGTDSVSRRSTGNDTRGEPGPTPVPGDDVDVRGVGLHGEDRPALGGLSDIPDAHGAIGGA
eukprot:scaffold827_cov369-Prasinococcus_capsulatus_cf.AAC.14